MTATKVNELLSAMGRRQRVATEGYVALEQVADLLRAGGPPRARGFA